ncbi:MAG: fibronectin type III domain-containing protein [Actinomycetota bacterium]|nr:fibronectin type III domain-containing protein [Actinomycetota bacterium]
MTPNIKPGDVVSAHLSGGASDSTATLTPTVTDWSKGGSYRLVVNGTRGPDAQTDQIEQRIVNPDLNDTDVGRRDVRAPGRDGPYRAVLRFPTPDTFRAIYTFIEDANTTAAEAQEMRDLAAVGQMRALSWMGTDVNANRQGLTISEFGELGGPGFGGCPAGPESTAPRAPADVAATAGDGSANVTWTPSTTIPDAPEVTGYQLTAVNTATAVDTSVRTPVCSTGCAGTIPNLTNGETYRVEVRALRANGPSEAGVAPDTVTPVAAEPPPPATGPSAPESVSAFPGSTTDTLVTARARWTTPVQPEGVSLDGWRVTAFDATSGDRIKSTFLDEPLESTTTTRNKTVRFAVSRDVFFTVQAIANDASGTRSPASPASNPVTAQ